MRKFLVAVVLMIGVMYIILRFAEIESLLNTLQHGDLRFILLALLFVLLWQANIAISYWMIYRILGIQEDVRQLLYMSLAAMFVNTVAPMGGMSGMTIFISEARRRNYAPGKATVASALYVLFDYAGFLAVLALGFIVLLRRDRMQVTEVVAAALLFLLALFLATMLYLAMRNYQQLGRFLAWGGRVINRLLYPFIHREYLNPQRAHSFAAEIAEGVQGLRHNPYGLLYPGLLAISSKAMMIMTLFMTFLAFGVDYSIGTLIAAFSIGYLFLIISPTPSGVGFVEGAMTLVLRSFYIPLSDAAVVTIAYRGLTFWLPLLMGMGAMRQLARTEPEIPTSAG